MSEVTLEFLRGFDDPRFPRERWTSFLGRAAPVFLTWEWQKAWWDSFGRGRLLLAVATKAGQVTAVAPLFADDGMVFFVGSGGSDYLDFVGSVDDPAVLASLLESVRARVPDLVGFRFYHVPESSITGARLSAVASQLGLVCYDEGELPAPALELQVDGEGGRKAARKKSLLRHESYFRRNGALEVEHSRAGSAILPHLDEFFDQHVERWRATDSPSLFLEQAQRDFYRRIADYAADSGWLRFTRVLWNGRPIAHHFGFCHQGTYLWYKPSFAVDLARHSPGEVLLRNLILAAIAEGAAVFDFGLGDESFKSRFATRMNCVRTWGVYPKEVVS